MGTIVNRRDLQRAHALMEMLDRMVACHKHLSSLSESGRDKVVLLKCDDDATSDFHGRTGARVCIREVPVIDCYLKQLELVIDHTRRDLQDDHGVIIDD